MLADAVDDVEHHDKGQHNHTQDNGHDQQQQNVADLAHTGENALLHNLKAGENFFQAEYAAVNAAEYGAGQAAAGDDIAQPHLLPLGQHKADHSQTQPLAQVTEHNAEEQAVGDGHKDGGVNLVIGGQTVHLQEGLEDPAQEGVLQFGGRGHVGQITRIVHHTGEPVKLVQLGLNLLKLVAGHPAHEVKGLAGVGGEAAHVVGVVHVAQVAVVGQQPVVLGRLEAEDVLLGLLGGLLRGLCLGGQLDNSLIGGAAGVGIDVKPDKVEGVEEGVHLFVGGLGGEIHAVDQLGLNAGGEEEDVVVLVEGLLETVVGLTGQVTKPEPGEVQVPEVLKVGGDALQLLQLEHQVAVVLGLLKEVLTLLGQIVDSLLQGVEVVGKVGGVIPQSGLKGLILQGDTGLVRHLFGPAEEGGIGVIQLKGTKPFDILHGLKGVFRVELLIDDALTHHCVKLIQGSRNGE